MHNNNLFGKTYNVLGSNVLHNNRYLKDRTRFSKPSRSFNSCKIVKTA